MLPLADDAHQAALRVHALLVDIARQHQLSPDASKPFIYGAQEELAWRTFLSIYGQRLYDGLERGLPYLPEADLVLRLDDSGRNDLTIHRAILNTVRAENLDNDTKRIHISGNPILYRIFREYLYTGRKDDVRVALLNLVRWFPASRHETFSQFADLVEVWCDCDSWQKRELWDVWLEALRDTVPRV